jgi:small subunit ribosomal protein S13
MRLVGVNIPDNKRIEYALTYVHGIGKTTADAILAATKIPTDKKAKDLTPDEMKMIQEYVEKNCKVEGELRQVIKTNIARLKEINCYRGTRHMKKLPTRGQRTKTNSRTVRGNVRKTATSGRRKSTLK